MNPKHFHTPITPASTRLRCPVCQEVVYSPAGIHPQCAVRQSDPPKPKNKPSKTTEVEALPPTASHQIAVGVGVDPTSSMG